MITEKPLLSSADQVLSEKKAAEKEFLPIVGPHKGKILAEEVQKAKPRRVLEVGGSFISCYQFIENGEFFK